MERVYIDMSQVDGSCVGVFVSGKDVIPVGTTAYSMPVEDRDEEYQRYADEYDIHFIFDDRMVNIDFFTVPWIDIMAWDSEGGYIGTVGGTTDMESYLPICYIDKDRKTYLIAADLKEFLGNCKNWKSELKLCEAIEIFTSKEEANKKYTFILVADQFAKHATDD